MKKRIVSLCLVLAMCLALLPTVALADGETVVELTRESIAKYKTTGVSTYYKLESGSYQLTDNIVLDACIRIYGAVKLDLNGYVLKLNSSIYGGSASGPVIICTGDKGSLTLVDSRPEVKHKFRVDDSGLWVLDEDNGTEIVKGGIITGGNANHGSTSNAGGGVNVSCPTFTMRGGSIVGCTAVNNGGGVNVGGITSFMMEGGTILGCTTNGDGGGVAVYGPKFTIKDGAYIGSCKAGQNGDGIYSITGIVADGGRIDADVYLNDSNSGISSSSATKTAFYGAVTNAGGTISAGIFYGSVKNAGTVSGGMFYGGLTNLEGGQISGGNHFTVTFDTNGGSSVADRVFFTTGAVQLMKPTDPEKEGYALEGWYKNEALTEPWDFDSDTVSKDITLYAKWEEVKDEPEVPGFVWLIPGGLAGATDLTDTTFVDVSRGAYYYNAVEWAYNRGIAGGVDSKHFAPDESCTRAQAVTMLWRAAGCPDVWGENPFVDVDASDYYYEAVLWAVANGITSGTDATHFSPDEPCTRGQIVTFLHRAARCYVAHESFGFVDVKSGSYCEDAVNWAVETGITNGTGVDTFSPDAPCTRAQIVTFLYRNG